MDKQLNARVNPELHNQIKKLSTDSKIIMNTLVETLLEIGLKYYLEGSLSTDSSSYITKDDLITFESGLLKKVESLINDSGINQAFNAIATDKTALSPEQKERVLNEVKKISTIDKHGKQITYSTGIDGSIVLRSVRGTDIRTLKKLDGNQLKEIGLRREVIGDQVKFYPIEY
jgi:hypothetical protein